MSLSKFAQPQRAVEWKNKKAPGHRSLLGAENALPAGKIKPRRRGASGRKQSESDVQSSPRHPQGPVGLIQ